MVLPENIRELIDKEISRTWDKDKDAFFNLDRRKGETADYKPLLESQWDKYLSPWNNFHKEITYDS